MLILKINKQGPYKKDVFRAPGHQGSIKKLIHYLSTGRMVNIEHYSVYTIASVLKVQYTMIALCCFNLHRMSTT